MASSLSTNGAPALSDETMASVTLLLERVRKGDNGAWDRVFALLYRELHQIAQAQLRMRQMDQASPTSLVSSAWLKLADAAGNAENRRHLVGLMAHAMRYAILDEAKKRLAAKRGTQAPHLPLDEEEVPGQTMRAEDLLQLDHALKRLATVDPRLEAIVELRYFAGLSDREIGALLDISERNVRREWLSARSYLISQLGTGTRPD